MRLPQPRRRQSQISERQQWSPPSAHEARPHDCVTAAPPTPDHRWTRPFLRCPPERTNQLTSWSNADGSSCRHTPHHNPSSKALQARATGYIAQSQDYSITVIPCDRKPKRSRPAQRRRTNRPIAGPSPAKPVRWQTTHSAHGTCLNRCPVIGRRLTVSKRMPPRPRTKSRADGGDR